MTVEGRLKRLEKQSRRLKGGLCAVALTGLSLLAMGQGFPSVRFDTVLARKIQVIGDNGKVAVAIASSPALGGLIFVFNPDGGYLAAVGATDRGRGTVTTYSPQGRPLVEIGATPDGDGSILNRSSGGKELIRVTASADTGDGVVAAYDRAGNLRAMWPPWP